MPLGVTLPPPPVLPGSPPPHALVPANPREPPVEPARRTGTANRVASKPPSHPSSPTGSRCASVAGRRGRGRRAAVAGQQPKGRRCLLAAVAGRYHLGAPTAGATCRPAAGAQIHHGTHGGEVDHLNLDGPDFFLMKSHYLCCEFVR